MTPPRLPQARKLAIAVTALLILAGGLQLIPPAAASTSGSAPWQQPYHFRREVTVSNPSSTAAQDYPLLLDLNFSQGRVFSGNEIMLFNSTGVEVPTYLVDQSETGGYVTSAVLLAFLSVPAASTVSLWVYYGSAQAAPPEYRLDTPTGGASLGPVSVVLGPQPGGSAVTFTYGMTYTETVEPAIAYGQPNGTAYGPDPLAPLDLAVGWHIIGNRTSSGAGATLLTASFAAGSLRYRQVEVVSNSSLVSVDQVTNVSPAGLSGVKLSLIVDASQLASLGPLTLAYNSSSGVATASAGGAYVGFSAGPLPATHEIGSIPGLIFGLAARTNATSAALGSQPGFLLSWPSVSLGPGDSFSVETVLSLSSGPASIEGAAPSPAVEVGPEQYSPDYLPVANGLWGATVGVNSSVPPSGVKIPLQVSSGTLLPDTLTLGGMVSYTWPSPAFTGAAGVWSAVSSSSGNATAYASPSFWSVEQGGFLGRVASFNYDASSAAKSSLTSTKASIGRSSDARLSLSYKATLASLSGNPAGQELYAALLVYNGTDGPLNSILYFPAEGTSIGVTNSTSCGLAPPGTGSGPDAFRGLIDGQLVADGSWRTLTVDLSSLLGSGGYSLQMLFCSSTSRGFVGQMDLQIASAAVGVTAPAQDVMSATVPGGGSSIGLDFVAGALPASAAVTVDLGVGFDVVSTVQMSQSSGASFASSIPEPTVTAHGSAVPLTAEGIVVYTQFAGLRPALSVNGTTMSGISAAGGVVTATRVSLGSAIVGDPPASTEIVLHLQAESLNVRVTDASGDPLSGATVNVLGGGAYRGFNGTTGSDGVLSFELMPWNYSINVISKGSPVYASAVDLSSNQTVQAQARVYRVTIEAKNILGAPLGSATVEVSGYGFSQTLTMSGGSLDLLLPAGTPYQIAVSVAGDGVYKGTVTAATNGSIVVISTSYTQPLVELGAAVAVLATVALTTFILFRVRGMVFPSIKARRTAH